jgi:hypothetical protein
MESGVGVRTPRLAIKILAVLVESGMIYVLIGVSSASVYKHGLSRFPFSLQVTTLASIVISLVRLQLSEIPTVITLVDIQLAVRNSF